jgi:GDP-L-fucose synthase
MNKILVTGGSGLVGSQFKSKNYKRISSKDLNLLDQKSIKDYLESNKEIDSIIHCAARVGGVKANMEYPAEFTYENLKMNTGIIEEAKNAGIKNLVCFSSTCVFPDKVEYPLSPDKIHLGPPHPSNYGYAYAKRMADTQIQSYREQYGVNYFSVIPCNIYGPNDNYHLEDAHVVPSLIHKFYLAKERGEDVTIWGSGSPLREFIYSEDVARLVEILLETYKDASPVILSTSNEISIKDLVYLIADIYGHKGKIIWDTSKPEGQYRKPSDNSVIKELAPNFKFTPIEEGLRKSIEWFIENYLHLRK